MTNIKSTSLSPLLRKPGEVNMPGMNNYILFVPAHYVTSTPVVNSEDGTDPVLTGTFAFKSEDYNFRYVDCATKSVGHTSSIQGEEGSRSFLQKGDFFHPGAKKEVIQFAAEVANTPGYLIMSTKSGEQIMVGQPGNPVTLLSDGNLGKAATDAKGFTFNFEWDAPVPVYYLEKPIEIESLKG